MISKGTTHNYGAKLASYMTSAKEGERAEMWDLRGFEATNIKDAFRDVQIMAEATRCQQPFFHVQVRNREGETLTRPQWEAAANRIERMLGLTDQPRAIAFHINEETGHEHMHVAWSRIDENTLTARPLPFFKQRLKKISRELELHFGLEPVTSKREGPIKYAPTRAQEEQARRLGLDIHEARDTIRECWDRSDNGRSFEAALAEKGMVLAKGDKRDFIVIDREGGMHALGKRILDVSAAQIRNRMSDQDRDQLPTVEQAREFIGSTPRQRKRGEPAPTWQRDNISWDDRLFNAALEKEKKERHFAGPKPSRKNRDHPSWDDRLFNAAIEKEKRERDFAEPRLSRKELRAHQEKHWPIRPLETERATFQEAAKGATRDTRPEKLKGYGARIWTIWRQSHRPRTNEDGIPTGRRPGERQIANAFADALHQKDIAFAVVTKEEAERSTREAAFAKAVGNYAPRYKEGEIVAVTAPGREYRRNGEIIPPRRVHRLDQSLAGKFVKAVGGREQMKGIEATKKLLDERVQHRSAHWRTIRLDNATGKKRAAPVKALKQVRFPANVPLRAAGKTLDFVGNAIGNLFAPKLSPQQIRDGETATLTREAEADHSIDLSRYTAGLAQQRQQQEQEREAERRQHRERGGGDRDR